MLRRLSLIITLIAALGAGIAVAGSAGQKDKIELADKLREKAESDAQAGVFAFDLGEDTSYLGAYLEEVTPERTKELGLTEERGAVVMKVVTGSPAEKSGLKENDVIVSFNGRRVDSVRELQRLLSETPPDR